jgi:hypothetical protein
VRERTYCIRGLIKGLSFVAAGGAKNGLDSVNALSAMNSGAAPRASVLRDRGGVRCGLEHVIEIVAIEVPTAYEDSADLASVMDIVEGICVQQNKVGDLALFDGSKIF